jgi:tRNA1(Val) A37 N6-methylase TrmN6
MENNTILVKEDFLRGKIKVYQYEGGYKSGVDAILLASCLSFNLKELNQKKRVLDLGCGVGVAGLALASRVDNVDVIGLEKEEVFYNLALKNAAENIFTSSCFKPILGDLKNHSFNEQFDAILTNPPYYTDGNNPNASALKNFGNIEQHTKLKDFIDFAFKNLKNEKYLYVIQRSERLKELLDLLSEKHWGSIEIFPIYSYINKPAKRFIIKAKKLGRGQTSLNWGIVMHEASGEYSKHAKDILENGNNLLKEEN